MKILFSDAGERERERARTNLASLTGLADWNIENTSLDEDWENRNRMGRAGRETWRI